MTKENWEYSDLFWKKVIPLSSWSGRNYAPILIGEAINTWSMQEVLSTYIDSVWDAVVKLLKPVFQVTFRNIENPDFPELTGDRIVYKILKSIEDSWVEFPDFWDVLKIKVWDDLSIAFLQPFLEDVNFLHSSKGYIPTIQKDGTFEKEFDYEGTIFFDIQKWDDVRRTCIDWDGLVLDNIEALKNELIRENYDIYNCPYLPKYLEDFCNRIKACN